MIIRTVTRREDPEAFALLTENEVLFRYRSEDALIDSTDRIIGESIGKRHLQGCYSDRDGLLRTLRILESHGD